jgi:hypothetical protein
MKRNCAYTGKDSLCKDNILPRDVIEDEIHNWANGLPSSIEYKESKGSDFPTDLEMDIHETFYLIEITRVRLKYLEKKLEKLQAQNNERKPIQKTGAKQKKKEKIKQKQIETAIVEKEIVEDNSSKIEEYLNNKKKALF